MEWKSTEVQKTLKTFNKRIRKDKIFILVLAIVAASLFYQTASMAVYIVQNRYWTSIVYWSVVIGNILAVYAIMYLIKNYRNRIKIGSRNKEEMIKVCTDTGRMNRFDAEDLLKKLGMTD